MRSRNTTKNDLIFDLGVNHGEDTDYYLDKGFRVVGAEADPILVERLRSRFAEALACDRFVLEPVGVMETRGRRAFHRNLECDHGSSFDAAAAGRNQARTEATEVDCLTLADLFERYGCPYYLKMNLTGVDRDILATLKSIPVRPTFLSLEEFDAETINALFALGYNMFSIRPQHDKSWVRLPDPPREGRFVQRLFTPRDSGPFGREVPGWMSLMSARKVYRRLTNRLGKDGFGPPGEWYDLHATHWPRAIDDRSLDLFDERELD